MKRRLPTTDTNETLEKYDPQGTPDTADTEGTPKRYDTNGTHKIFDTKGRPTPKKSHTKETRKKTHTKETRKKSHTMGTPRTSDTKGRPSPKKSHTKETRKKTHTKETRKKTHTKETSKKSHTMGTPRTSDTKGTPNREGMKTRAQTVGAQRSPQKTDTMTNQTKAAMSRSDDATASQNKAAMSRTDDATASQNKAAMSRTDDAMASQNKAAMSRTDDAMASQREDAMMRHRYDLMMSENNDVMINERDDEKSQNDDTHMSQADDRHMSQNNDKIMDERDSTIDLSNNAISQNDMTDQIKDAETRQEDGSMSSPQTPGDVSMSPRQNDIDRGRLIKDIATQWTRELCNRDTRPQAMRNLVANQHSIPHLSSMLNCNTKAMHAVLEVISSCARLLHLPGHPHTLPLEVASNTCNAINLLKTATMHLPAMFVRCRMVSYIKPYLKTVNKAPSLERLRLTCISMLEDLVRTDQPILLKCFVNNNIHECLFSLMNAAGERCKTKASYILIRMLNTPLGLQKIVFHPRRLLDAAQCLKYVIIYLVYADSPDVELVENVMRCYCLLGQVSHALRCIRRNLPAQFFNGQMEGLVAAGTQGYHYFSSFTTLIKSHHACRMVGEDGGLRFIN